VTGSIERNVEYWSEQAADYAVAGRRSWLTDEITWGQFTIPESQVAALPDVAGADVVELGCGTGYISAWLKRRGARRVVGLDPTPAQLATAAALGREIGPAIPLARAAGEAVPLRDGSFDLAVSEYGASLWADPERWIPEAARLLRPGGELVFLTNSLLQILTAPDAEAPSGPTLVRPQREMTTVEFTGDPGVEFHLPHGDMLRLLRRSGFEVLDLLELYVPDGAADQAYITAAWGQQWPVEEIWRARRR